MAQFIFTEEHSAGLIARLTLGAVMLIHGLQKTLGMFGGKSLLPTLDDFVVQGIPYALGAFVIGGETIAAIALIIGFAGRIAASWVAVILLVASVKVHFAHGFFMNWSGTQLGEGLEFHLLAIALALIVIIAGSGTFSYDRWLTRRYWA